MNKSNADGFGEWVILELMGHRKLAGYLTADEIAGKGFLRIDIPSGSPDKPDVTTQYYSPSAVYCITPVSEDLAMRSARHLRPVPIARYELEHQNVNTEWVGS